MFLCVNVCALSHVSTVPRHVGGVTLRGKSTRTTNDIGAISEAMISARFLQLGFVVYIPCGGKQRYDLLVEDAERQFWRIQCKTARLENEGSVIVFHTASHNVALRDKQRKSYRGQCDLFAIYCEELNKVYLLPVDQVGTARAKLRLSPARNKQVAHVRWARDYEF
jgi:hypothetical protein